MLNNLIRSKLIFTALTLFLFNISIKGQEDNVSISKDTITLKEITIEQDRQTKITGVLTGKITLHVEGVKNLPSIMGNTDLLKMLQLTPGVQTSGDGNSNLYIRGGDTGLNLLLYNENTIYSPGHILTFFPLFNVDHLSSLELIKSGVNAQYGGFLSSAISVKSKEDLPSKLSMKGNVGLLSSQTTIDLPLGEKFGAYISGRKTYLELLLKPLLKATVNKNTKDDINDMGYDFFDTNVTLIGKLSQQNKLVINAFISSDNLTISDEEIALDGYLKWKNTSLSAKLETLLGQSSQITQYFKYSKYKNKLQTGQAEMYIDLLSSVEDIGYKNKIGYQIAGIPFESGIEYTFHNVLPQDTKTHNVGMEYQRETMGRSNAHDMALYTSAILRMLPKLYLEPGLRYNIYNSTIKKSDKTKTFQSIDFRLAGRYELNRNTFIRASYSHNNQYMNKLTPSSLGLPTDFWITSSSDIKPQRGDEISLGGYKSILDGAFELSSDIYFRKMKNLTEFNQNFLDNEDVPFTDKILYGKGYAYGVEIMLKKNIGKFTGWLSYTLGKSNRKFEDINNGKTFPSRYDRTHDLSIVAAYTFNQRWDASIVYVYATGNAYTQPSSWYFINNIPIKEYGDYNGTRMPNYNRTDISINYWFKKDNGLNFSIYNMFMVNNPVYVFLLVNQNKKTGKVQLETKRKQLFSIVPSISWKYKF